MTDMTALFALLVLLQTASPAKVDIVTISGCVTPGPNDTWFLTNATDPVVDQRPADGGGRGAQRGAAPAPTTPPAVAPPAVTSGKNRYRLIGILELGVPDHKGHTVTVKGLLLPAFENDEPKINLTSVKTVTPACAKQPPM